MKKKIATIALCAIIASSLAACSSNNSEKSVSVSQSSSGTSEISSTPTSTPEPTSSAKKDKNGFDKATNTNVTFWGHELSIPSYWVVDEDNSLSTHTYFVDENGIVVAMLQFQCNSTGSMNRDNIESDFNDLLDSLSNSLNAYQFINSSTTSFCNEEAYSADFTCSMNDVLMESRVVSTKHDGSTNMYGFFLLQSADSEYDYFGDFEKMIESATYGNNSDSAVSTPTATPEPTPDIPLEYNNALSKAHDYLNYTAFSYSGLIDQLEYEGYSTEACTYAVDNCGADWNEQALQKAQSYLDYSAFSYAGLIDQLEYEGFTAEQSTYAVDGCGADWNEQAANKAQEYLDYTSFSRQGLIDQLIYEGFTSEQSEYGAAAVGY